MDKIKEILQKIIVENKPILNENLNAYEASGGNFDDAYAYGVEDGKYYFAKELLVTIKKIENDQTNIHSRS